MTEPTLNYYKRFTNSALILAFIALIILLVLKGFKVLLLILGGILFATYFLGLSKFITAKTGLNSKLSLVLNLVLTFGFTSLLIYKVTPNISQQVIELKETLPKAIEKTNKAIDRNESLNFLVQPIRKSIEVGRQDEGGYIKAFFSSVFGVIGDLYIVVFLGFFFIAGADSYVQGIVKLFPKHRRERTAEILANIGYTLRNWLLGKLMSMVIVGSLVTIGLYILGVPQALTLGLFTAALAFIPNIGPLISLVPALLIAFSISNELAIYTLVVYLVIQAVESNIITPMIHKEMIAMPMAMVLIAQVLLGVFTGYLGLILAVPILAIVMVVVKKAYIEDILHDHS